jgi:hypothetical protein
MLASTGLGLAHRHGLLHGALRPEVTVTFALFVSLEQMSQSRDSLASANVERRISYRSLIAGRSGQPWLGFDIDTFADDLADTMEKLDNRHARAAPSPIRLRASDRQNDPPLRRETQVGDLDRDELAAPQGGRPAVFCGSATPSWRRVPRTTADYVVVGRRRMV